jgi:multiple sugar transport system substrate-binding protein
VAALARAIHGTAENLNGMFFDWTITGNWAWQALVFSHGGTMLSADERQVAMANEHGQRAMAALRLMVDEGRMPDLRSTAAISDFFAGRLGISMQSTAQLGRYNREIGGRFPLVCGRFPIPGPNARLPAGGNVAMMFARDAAKQAAAWEFIKFATGPVGATMMVNATGYMPASTIPAQREEMLGRFYRENPNHMVTFRQQDVITGWYAFPGQNALRITDNINDHLQSVVAKRAEPAAALTRMAADVQALLPRR